MAADYAGLRDVSEAQKEAAALAASPACPLAMVNSPADDVQEVKQ
jgi:hypothetical protein